MGIFTHDPRESLALSVMRWRGDFIPPSPEEILSLANSGKLDQETLEQIWESQNTVRQLVREIDTVPRDFNPYNVSAQPLEVINAYRLVVSQLLDSGVARWILALDWLVDRDESWDTSLWLIPEWVKSLRDRQSLQESTFWVFHIFMDKGSWNGRKQLNLRRSPVPDGNTPFIHVWVWDRLYFNISDIIAQWVQKDFRNNKHVGKAIGIISQIVQVNLRKRWYTEDTDYAIGKWVEKEDASFDMNEIYDILRWLRFDNSPSEDVIDIEHGSIFSSEIFSWDDTDLIWVPELYVILIILWYDTNKIYTFLSHRFTDISNKLSVARDALSDEESRNPEWKFNPRKSQLKKVVKDLEEFYKELSEVITWWPWSMKAYFSEKWIWNINLPKDVFEDDFFRGIYADSASETRPNLNERAVINFHDFFQWYFTDIRKKLFSWHAERFMFIHATRSDSHEDDSNFEADMRDNLKILAQWWILLTDWVNESFSWLHRLEIINSLVEKHNNTQNQNGEKCEVKVLFDEENKKVKSIIVLKWGWNIDTLLEWLLDKNVQLREVQESITCVSVYIEQQLRKCIIWSEWKVHRLKWKHWLMPLMVKEILKRVKMDSNDSVEDEIIRESLDWEILEFFEEHQDFFSFLEPSEWLLHTSQ